MRREQHRVSSSQMNVSSAGCRILSPMGREEKGCVGDGRGNKMSEGRGMANPDQLFVVVLQVIKRNSRLAPYGQEYHIYVIEWPRQWWQ